MSTTRARTGAIFAAAALILAACGDSDDAEPAATTAAETDDTMAMSDEEMSDMDDMDTEDGEHDMGDMDMDDMDMGAMNMGDPSATPAEEVAGAELVGGDFVLLDTRPSGYDEVIGTAVMARHDGGTTVTIRLEGLPPGETMISHVHEAPCSEGGGDHYQFDPNGSEMPPNEIHLLFDAAEDGSGFMTAENDMVVGDGGVSVVVHPLDLIDNKIACVDFAPIDAPEAASSGEAIEAAGVVDVEVAGGEVVGGVQRVEVGLGTEVVLTVNADLSEEVHVHTYDLFADVAPGETAEIVFTADVPGVHEIELEGSGLLLVQLEVS
ncbi:MAG: hypothetical protein AAGA99_20275 [Actinomycetota bacterium]